MTPADVIALFPKCSVCGAEIQPTDAVELDPSHAYRVKHTHCLRGSA